jgi:hypothetical protein
MTYPYVTGQHRDPAASLVVNGATVHLRLETSGLLLACGQQSELPRPADGLVAA